MKKMFDEDDEEFQDFDKAKIIVSVIPVILIVLILAIMLLINNRNKEDKKADDVQQSIMDYADENTEKVNDRVQADSDAVKDSLQEIQTEELPTPSATPEVTPSPTPYKEIMEQAKVDLSKIKFDKDAQLKEMMAYWADSNQKALDDLVNLDRFKAMSWKLKGTDDCYYYGDLNASGQADGTGIAVYADNQYYYGEWKNGVRNGNGTWVHYHFHNGEKTNDVYTYHQYTGSWVNDLPEGEGSEHYDFNSDNLKDDVRYSSNRIGSYHAGLVHGEFYITTIEKGKEDMMEWEAEAQRGSWTYSVETKDKKGNRPVFKDYNDPNNYVWMLPKDNVNIGVPCLISKNKN